MKCIKCPIGKTCSQDYSVNCRYSLKMYQQGRADGIEECINSLGMVLDNDNIKSELRHLFKELKEKNNENSTMDNSNM